MSTPIDYGHDELYDLREKVRKGETVTDEEYKRVLEALRQGRETGAKSKAKKASSKKAVEAADTDALINTFV